MMAAWFEIFDPVAGQWARFPDSLLTVLPPGPPGDHGALSGLLDDDHTQYHNDARGDARYAVLAKGVTGGDTHDHVGGDGAQIAYAGLSGLPALGSIADNAEADFAVAAKGVTNGDTHDHLVGDGAQVDHGGLAGLADDDHTQYIKHSLATAISDFLCASGVGVFVKKTLAEIKVILGLGSAAYTAAADYAVAAKGVTNGDTHDHVGGDGAQVDHGGLGGLADDDHTQYAPKADPAFTTKISTPQVQFPAAQSPSADVNNLDDYQEGSFTAAMSCGTSGTITLYGSYRTLFYTKIGRMVTIKGLLDVQSVSSPLGALTITGLPFTSMNAAGTRAAVAVHTIGTNTTGQLIGRIDGASTIINIHKLAAGVTTNDAANCMKADTELTVTVSYFVD